MMSMVPPRIYADFHNADRHGRLRLNCRGTTEDLAEFQLQLSEGMTLRLYMEDLETTGTVLFSAEENLWVAEIDWDVVRSFSRLSQCFPDDALVVRGGKQDPATIYKSTATHPSGVRGISVVCASGKSLSELSEAIPHREITSTTVGEVRLSGGNVIQTEGASPFHATLLIADDTQPRQETVFTTVAESRERPSLFVDFNNTDRNGSVRLNTNGTLEDLELRKIELCEGVFVELYDLGEFRVPAFVRRSPEGWVAEVEAWSELEH